MVAFVCLFIVFDSGVLSVCLYAFLNGLMFFFAFVLDIPFCTTSEWAYRFRLVVQC